MNAAASAMTRERCRDLDRTDPLASRRGAFVLDEGRIYLDGNSLGPLTHAARRRVQEVLDHEWGHDLVAGWNLRGWMDLPVRLGARIAPLVGAAAGDVVVGDSTSVNLFKLAASFMRDAAPRTRVVTELGNFPTDLYVLEGLADLMPARVELAAVPRGDVLAAIDDQTALVVLTHVHYKTAETYDLAGVTAAAHERGAAVLWDLSHSVGALPVDLGSARADLAVGCTYKYLNGGPGAPAFLYVRPDLQARLEPAIAGWLGHEAPFAFDDDYRPAAGVARHRAGTPGILGMAALDGSLEVFDGLDLAARRAKSLTLTDLFIGLVESRCAAHGLELVTPREHARRGSHVSFRHPEGYGIIQALIARGVTGDFRAPDVLRFGFTPLYTRHVDVWDAVAALAAVLDGREWSRGEHRRRRPVT